MMNGESMIAINLQFQLFSRCSHRVILDLPEGLKGHLEHGYNGSAYFYNKLIIFNNTMTEKVIEQGSIIASMFLAPPESLCECDHKTSLLLVTENNGGVKESELPEEFKDRTSQAQTRLTSLFLMLEEDSLEIAQVQPIINDDLFPVLYQGKNNYFNEQHVIYNKALILSRFLADNRVIQMDVIRQIQKNDEIIRTLYDKANSANNTSEYVIKNKILFRRSQMGNIPHLQLVIDQATLEIIIESLHRSGHHFSDDATLALLRKHFSHPLMKQFIKQQRDRCIPCTFASDVRQPNYIAKHDEELPMPGQVGFVDLLENFSRDGDGYRYVLCYCDGRTNFSFFIPLKTRNSTEVAKETEKLFQFFVPERIITDFGSCFKGNFQALMVKYGISHEKSCVSRPQANNAERTVALGRNFIRKFLLNLNADQAKHWSRHLVMATTLFNSSVINARDSLSLSRYELFHGARFYYNSRFMSIMPELPTEDKEKLYDQAQESLDKARKTQRERLFGKSNHEQFHFPKGSFVTFIANKEYQTVKREAGQAPNSYRIYRVLDSSKTGARLLNLVDGAILTADHKKLRPLLIDELQCSIPLSQDILGSFASNLFTRGDGKLLLKSLRQASGKDYEEAIVEQELSRRNLNSRGRPINETVEETHDSDEPEKGNVRQEIPESLKPSPQEVVHDLTDQTATEGCAPDEITEARRYNLRTRKNQTPVLVTSLKTSYTIKNTNKVRFNGQVTMQAFNPNDNPNQFEGRTFAHLKSYMQPIRNMFLKLFFSKITSLQELNLRFK